MSKNSTSSSFVAGPFDTGHFAVVPILRKETFTCLIFDFSSRCRLTSAMALGLEFVTKKIFSYYCNWKYYEHCGLWMVWTTFFSLPLSFQMLEIWKMLIISDCFKNFFLSLIPFKILPVKIFKFAQKQLPGTKMSRKTCSSTLNVGIISERHWFGEQSYFDTNNVLCNRFVADSF